MKKFDHRTVRLDEIQVTLSEFYKNSKDIFSSFIEVYENEIGKSIVEITLIGPSFYSDEVYQLFHQWFVNLDEETVKSVITLSGLKK